MSDSVVRVVSVLPALLGTYGDQGNVLVLERRLRWRSVPVEVHEVEVGQPVPRTGDLYVLGGGEDDAQLAALDLLRGSGLVEAVQRGATVLAVCAGLQLLGQSVERPGGAVAGLGLLDLTTGRLPRRALGETVVEPDPEWQLPTLTGFANHAGSTVLGAAARPLGRVVQGPGNAGDGDATEGVVQGSVVGTYLHGPVLARNPALADLLLERVTGAPLSPLADHLVGRLREERLAGGRRGRRG